MVRGLNKVLMMGLVSSKVEMRYTSSGRPVTAFSISVPHNQSSEQFNVIAWGNLAEFCNGNLSPDAQVYIEGRLQTREWQDNNGISRSRTEIIAQEILPIESQAEKPY